MAYFWELGVIAKRCVTSLVNPVRHCPPSAVMPAERTSRSDVGSCVLHCQFDWEEFIVVVRHTSAAQATTPEKIIAGSGE